MEEVIREGKWKCPGCGTKNRGRDVKCPSCGQARENVDFEYDENADAVTDAGDRALAEGGADWVCGYCSTSNRAGSPKCKQCGAGADEGKQREVGDVPPPPPPRPEAGPAATIAGAAATGLGCFGKVLVAGIVGLVVLVMIAAHTSQAKLTLTRAHWMRDIEVEHLVPVVERGWELPAGAKLISTSNEIHHHDQVADGTRMVQRTYTERVQTGTKRVKVGTKNMGNGFFKDLYDDKPVYSSVTKTRTESETVYRSVPVYRTKYSYEVERWRRARDVPTSGDDTAPAWGEPKLVDKERESKRTEVYEVEFTGNGKTYPWKPPEKEFTALKLGQSYDVELNGFGDVNRVVK